jgi:plasmid stabilization system protein ParE
MPYLVRLTDRALRDLEAIYEFIEATTSERAFAWFSELVEAIYSLERLAERGAVVPGHKKLRQLFFGKKPDTYRIIYTVYKHNRAVNVLHIRHGAGDAFKAG